MKKKDIELIFKGADDQSFQELLDDLRPQGEWKDHSEEGYVECPICNCLTNCDDNIDELHYCWNCGAKMRKGGVGDAL